MHRCVVCGAASTSSTLKTGPAGTAETKLKVAGRLRERGEAGDLRAADVIEAALS